MCIGETLNIDSCSKFGEILREFGETLGKYCILDGRFPGSIGLTCIPHYVTVVTKGLYHCGVIESVVVM